MNAPNILVVGYGAMTGAMVEGWLASGFEPARITLYNPRPKPAPPGVRLLTALPDRPPEVLLLGFKPAMLDSVAPDLAGLTQGDTLVVSVLAGITLDTLAAAFPRARSVVRFMPNLAAALRASVTALASSPLAARERALIDDLARRLGHAEWLPSEEDFETVTALAGCGPAFVYRFIDALAEAARALGLEGAAAERMAVAMTEGAARLASAADMPPRALAQRVASPGGMTQRGLDVLDDGDALTALVAATLRAARDRGREMGKPRDTA